MLFVLFFIFAESKTKICICNKECSSLCPSDRYILTNNLQFNDYFQSHFIIEKEIELDFYSNQNKSTFEIDSKFLQHKDVTLKNIHDSNIIKVKIKNGLSSIEKIVDIQANSHIKLPNVLPFQINKKDKGISSSPDTSLPIIEPTPIPISVGIAQMKHEGLIKCKYLNNFDVQPEIDNIQNLGCNLNDLESSSAYECGYKCWTKEQNAKFEYTFKGVKFEIYGKVQSDYGKFDVILDGKIIKEVDAASQTEAENILLYSSDEIKYQEHTVQMVSKDKMIEIYKLTYWPSLKAKRVNSTEFAKTGSWTKESDGIGGVREYSDSNGGVAIKSLRFSKIWVYGVSSEKLKSECSIKYGNYEDQISQYSEDSHEEGILMYESPAIQLDEYHLTFTFNDIGMIYCVYYLDEFLEPETPQHPPMPTLEPSQIPISVGLQQMTRKGSYTCDPDKDLTPETIKELGCDFNNLESSYNCGFRCWTDWGSFSYTFKGVQFAIYGKKKSGHGVFDIILDGEKFDEVDEKQETVENKVLVYTSKEIEYKEHTLEMKGIGNTFEIYKITYWPFLNAKRMNCTEFTKTKNWYKETDGIGGVREYTTDVGATATNTFQFSKIWVYGTKYSQQEDMKIQYGDIEFDIKQKSESRSDGILIYESEILPYDTYTITFTTSGKSMLYCVYYIDGPLPTPLPTPTPIPTPVPISVGLAQMKVDGNHWCDPSHFTIEDAQKLGCNYNDLESSSAYKCGYTCWSDDGSATFSYTFKGVKFQIYGTTMEKCGKFDVILDGEKIYEVDSYERSRKDNVLLYSSDEIEYKEHTVQMKGKGDFFQLYKLTYWPAMKAKRVNSTEFAKIGSWTKESDGIGGVREYIKDPNGIALTLLRFSKIWIYGIKAGHLTSPYKIQFGDIEKEIDQYSEERVEGVLMYESPVVLLDDYKLTFSTDSSIMLYCVYYLEEQIPSETPSLSPIPTPLPTPLSTPIPTPVPISVGLSQMTVEGNYKCEPEYFSIGNIQNLGCNRNNLESSSAYTCGYKCWSDDGSATFSYTFKGVKFQIYGITRSDTGKFDIVIDDEKTIEIDTQTEKRYDHVLLYTSDDLEYKEHTIQMKGKGNEFELYKLAYWPSLQAKRVNSTEFAKTGSWSKESDGIGGIREFTEDNGAVAIKYLRFSKIWVYGIKNNKLDTKYTIKYGEYEKEINQYSDNPVEGVIMHESDPVPLDLYELKITTSGRSMIYCIYYIDEELPIPTQIPESETIDISSSPDTSLPIIEPTPIPISVGIAQMKHEGSIQCKYSDNYNEQPNIDNIQNLGCSLNDLESLSAYECGYKCWTKEQNAKFEYTFKGVKFEIYGKVQSNFGKFDVILDGKIIKEVDASSQTEKSNILLYSSDEIEYQEHTVQMVSKNEKSIEIYKLTYWPAMKAKRVNSTEFAKMGIWTKESDGIGGVREYTKDPNGIALKTLRFSKIWIYGMKARHLTSPYKIQFGDIEKEIDQHSEEYRDEGALMYESPVVLLDDYKLTFSTDSSIMLYCVYYLEEQIPSETPSLSPIPTPLPTPLSTPIPTPVPISVGLSQMTVEGNHWCDPTHFTLDSIQDLGCDINNLESSSAYDCGYVCWSEDGTATFSYSFKGVKFQIYGTTGQRYGKFDVIIDDNTTIEIDTHENNRRERALLFTSDELEYKEHTIQMKGKNDNFELYKLAYWPAMNAKRLNSTDFDKTGKWIAESDGIGGVREYANEKGCTMTKTFKFSKLWIYGVKKDYYNEPYYISYGNFNKEVEQLSDKRIDGVLMYESGVSPYEEYKLTFNIPTDKMILNCVFYVDEPLEQDESTISESESNVPIASDSGSSDDLSSESTIESSSEPVIESSSEPVIESSSESVIESSSESAIESSSESVIESSSESVIESSSESVIESSSEPVIESSSEPIIASSSEPDYESNSEPVIESSSDSQISITSDMHQYSPSDSIPLNSNTDSHSQIISPKSISESGFIKTTQINESDFDPGNNKAAADKKKMSKGLIIGIIVAVAVVVVAIIILIIFLIKRKSNDKEKYVNQIDHEMDMSDINTQNGETNSDPLEEHRIDEDQEEHENQLYEDAMFEKDPFQQFNRDPFINSYEEDTI